MSDAIPDEEVIRSQEEEIERLLRQYNELSAAVWCCTVDELEEPHVPYVTIKEAERQPMEIERLQKLVREKYCLNMDSDLANGLAMNMVTVGVLANTVQSQRTEIERMTEELREQTRSFCTHCGKLFEKGKAGLAKFREHISECNTHPLQAMASELKTLREWANNCQCAKRNADIQRLKAENEELSDNYLALSIANEKLRVRLDKCEEVSDE